MQRRAFLISGTAVISALAARAQDKNFKLDVEVHYSGSGTVDGSHKIYVVLWDSPDFVSGGPTNPPLSLQPIASKSSVAHFTDLAKSPIYASMVYDPSGGWDGQSGPPPSGSSVGIYSTEPGKAAPIPLESGKTAKVTASFDDSVKMP